MLYVIIAIVILAIFPALLARVAIAAIAAIAIAAVLKDGDEDRQELATTCGSLVFFAGIIFVPVAIGIAIIAGVIALMR